MASQFEEDGLSEASSKLEKIIEDIVTKQNQTFTCRAVITISPIDTHSSYILACSSKDIAQQLTLYDCELFYNLEVRLSPSPFPTTTSTVLIHYPPLDA